MDFPLEQVKRWFALEGRSLPWREERTFYRVWVSEVMLQQTQAATVIYYFQRWMERFPSLADLAQAPEGEVIKMWEGLGYYSRARNLHKGAQEVMSRYSGILPQEEPLLRTIPGIGPYTAAAILAFAYNLRAAPVDANILRVISRYLAFEEDVGKESSKKTITNFVLSILPKVDPGVIGEALIEIGALVCKKKPACSSCPLSSSCLSYRNGLQSLIPRKKEREKTITLYRLVGIIEHEGEYLVTRGEAGRVMAGLYEFPYVELTSLQIPLEGLSLEEVKSKMEARVGVKLTLVERKEQEEHGFTRYKAYLFPYLFQAEKRTLGIWKKNSDLAELPFSSGHKKILRKI